MLTRAPDVYQSTAENSPQQIQYLYSVSTSFLLTNGLRNGLHNYLIEGPRTDSHVVALSKIQSKAFIIFVETQQLSIHFQQTARLNTNTPRHLLPLLHFKFHIQYRTYMSQPDLGQTVPSERFCPILI